MARFGLKFFVMSNAYILQSTWWKILNFFFIFEIQHIQDPTVTCVQKCFFIKNLLLVLEMAVLEHFGEKVVKNL